MKNNKKYIAPAITVVTFAVEKGFATSVPISQLETELELYKAEASDRSMEDYTMQEYWGGYNESGYWVSGDNHFWD